MVYLCKKRIEIMIQGSQRQIGMVISYIYSACQVFVQLIYVPLLFSAIGKDEYGLYQIVGSIMAYVISINSILAGGVSRYYCMYFAQGDQIKMENTLAISKRIYWGGSVVGVCAATIAAFIAANAYSGKFTALQVREIIVMIFILTINMIVTMNNTINIAAITAHEHFVFLKGVQLATLLIQPCLVLVLVHFVPSSVMVTIAVLCMNFICAVLQRIYAKNILKVKYTYHGWDQQLFKGLLSFSGVIILVSFADQVFWRSGQLILGYFEGAGPVAIYGIGMQIFNAFVALGTAVYGVFMPKVSRIYHKDHDNSALSAYFTKIGRISCYVIFPVISGFFLFGKDFIKIWMGDGYQIAYYVALIMMLPMCIDLIQGLGMTILQVENRYLYRGVLYAIFAILNILVVVVCCEKFGIIGTAIPTGVTILLVNIGMNIVYNKILRLDILSFWKSIMQLVIPLIFLVICLWFVRESLHYSVTFLSFVLEVFIYVILYCVFVFLFSFNSDEKSIVMLFLRKK